jgi:uncharacterized protein (TIGR02118 family)
MTTTDPDRFEHHDREVHVPLVKQLPGLRRYTFSRYTVPIRGGDAYYRIGELDFDDITALRQAFASPAGRVAASDVDTLSSTTGRPGPEHDLRAGGSLAARPATVAFAARRLKPGSEGTGR